MTTRLSRHSGAPSAMLVAALATALLASLLFAAPTRAAVGDIATVAGGADLAEKPGTEILQSAFGLAFHGRTLYIADPRFHVVRALDTGTGQERVVAGTGAEGATGDGGPATAARLAGPSGVAVDGDGRLLIADTGNSKVRRVDIAGVITTLAGTGEAGYGGDCDQVTTACPATAARFDHPLGVATDGVGNVYVADTVNNRVRRISPAGEIRTVAGSAVLAEAVGGNAGKAGGAGPGDGGPATLAALARPNGVATDTAGNLFIADTGNHRVRRVDRSSGAISTIAGGGIVDKGDGGAATDTQLNAPAAVTVDAQGGLVIADTGNWRVRAVNTAGVISTVAGTGGSPTFSGDGGPATAAAMLLPQGVAAGGGTAQFFIADSGNGRVRKVESGVITTVAGSGVLTPNGLAVAPQGAVLVADPNANMVRRIEPGGAVTRVAGTGTRGFSGDCAVGGGDCPATAARLAFPEAVATGPDGAVYVADTANNRVRRVDADGAITTAVGTGGSGRACTDMEAPTYVEVRSPAGVAVDKAGDLFIADTGNNVVCKLSADGSQIARVAGGGTPGDGVGDGGSALEAALVGPRGLAVDNAGNLLIADAGHGRVRRMDALTGEITTVAGGGSPPEGVGDGGPATSARLASPSAVAVDGAGNVFVAERVGNRLRRVDAGTGTITTVAGNGTWGFAGDGGPAIDSQLANPAGVAIDATGDVFVADTANYRLRRVEGVAVPVVATGGPGVSSVSPDRGPAYGGTEVKIVGRGFTGATAVQFGAGPTVPFRVHSDSELTAVSPTHGAGTVDVTVTSPLGRSARSATTSFTFVLGSWVATGPLGTSPSQVEGIPRTDHTATRLVDGSVLVAGGMGAEPTSAEVYDPVTHQWSGVGAMTTARRGHTATLLDPPACHGSSPPPGYPCGQVLVVGGVPATDTAELYDPASRSWSSVARMPTTRSDHTASLLEDGRVLVAGGLVQDTATPSGVPNVPRTPIAVIFDPTRITPGSTAQGTWTATAPMRGARVGHTATVLLSGKVLVAGGEDPDGTTAPPPAEVFDAGRGTWTATAGPGTPGRASHTASRLADGRVLVVGGRTAELYDPATDSWRRTAPTRSAHVRHAAAVLEPGTGCSPLCGRVLVAGNDGAGPTAAELYDPADGSWAPAASLLEGRHGHSATPLVDGTVLVAGGRPDGEHILRSAELFHPVTVAPALTVEGITPPAGPTTGGTEVAIRGSGFFPGPATVSFGDVTVPVTLAAGTVLVVTTPSHPQGTVDVRVTTLAGAAAAPFTFGAGSWAPTRALDSCAGSSTSCARRRLHSATLLDGPVCHALSPPEWCGLVLVAGGLADNATGGTDTLASAELYDPATGRWRSTGSMRAPHADHTATTLGDGRVLVVGGPSAELYDPGSGTWSPASPPGHGRITHTATLLADGRVLVAGGTADHRREDATLVRRTAELYDPASGSWSATASMATARSLHTATLLPGGEVLVTGGLGHAGAPSCEQPGPDFGCDELPLASTELYDPGTGRWTEATDLAVARFAHTATPFGSAACATLCGTVLVAGGISGSSAVDPTPVASTEIFHPASREWQAAAPLHQARAAHTATALPDGSVLVAGGGRAIGGKPKPDPTAEVFRPRTRSWSRTGSMATPRGVHSATLLDGPTCRAGDAGVPGYCGQVLAAGGGGTGTGPAADLGGAELYAPAPAVIRLEPARGPKVGGTEVVVEGTDMAGASSVTFGGVPALSFRVDSPTRVVAVAPPHPAGPVEVAIATSRGTSGHAPPDLGVPFTYDPGPPGRVTDLAASATSDSAVRLTFSSVPNDDSAPDASAPARSYTVKQSPEPITDAASFASAATLCGGACSLRPSLVGEAVTLDVTDLAPATTYHYAVQASNEGGAGPVSDSVAVTTPPRGATPTTCAPPAAAGAGAVAYPSGYSLVGLPERTVLATRGPLYSWFDQGAGGTYSLTPGAAAVAGGRGYWAWSACPHAVSLPGAGADSARFPLGAYHASMVGNPSATSPAVVAGHDFAARWDPALNAGAGGYRVSAYRERQRLGVGEGAWVFSYVRTEIDITVGG